MEKIIVDEKSLALIESAKAQTALASDRIIQSDADLKAVKTLSIQLKAIAKELEEKRLEFTRPITLEQNRINGLFNPVKNRLEIKSRELITDCHNWQKKKKAEIEEKNQSNLLDEVDSVLSGNTSSLPVSKMSQATDIIQTQKKWTFDLVDKGKVPMEYLQIDEAKINAAIKSGVTEISGLKIYKKETAVRR